MKYIVVKSAAYTIHKMKNVNSKLNTKLLYSLCSEREIINISHNGGTVQKVPDAEIKVLLLCIFHKRAEQECSCSHFDATTVRPKNFD